MPIYYYQEDYIYNKTPDDNCCLLLILDPELEDKVLSCLVDLDDDKEERPTKEDPHETPQATGQLPDVISIELCLVGKAGGLHIQIKSC